VKKNSYRWRNFITKELNSIAGEIVDSKTLIIEGLEPSMTIMILTGLVSCNQIGA
jgi:hypothetical protein